MTDRADSPDRVRAVFIGTGGFALPALRRLAAAPVDLVGVVTAPARAAGRHAHLQPSPVAGLAAALGIDSVLTPERLRRPEALAEVFALQPDLIVLADYGQIVPRTLLDVRFGALNLHPSLLPRHRGASPIPATILAGDERTGVALMRMDEGLDTGPLVALGEMDLHGDEASPALEAALAERGAALLVETLPRWLSGEVDARPQRADGATLTRPLRRADGRLDASRSAVQLQREVRAFQPWPGSWFEVPAGRFTVWRAGAVAAAKGAESGELRAESGELVLQTRNGGLRLDEVQPAGGRRMTGAELLRGRPGIAGQQLSAAAETTDLGPIERAVGYSSVP